MKKGFTIIELLVSMVLICLMTFSIITMALKFDGKYKKEVLSSREDFYIREALLYIEEQIENDTQYVVAQNDTIELVRTDGIHTDFISKSNANKLVIIYKQYNSYLSTNDIMKGVSDFQVNVNNKIIIITIKGENGEVFERCLGIRTQE